MKAVRDETLEFDFGAKAAPVISPDDVASLVAVLGEGKAWMTAEKIAEKVQGWTERKVRRIAGAACPVVVSYPGAPGYKLWSLCSVEEINHCISSFESQARDMTRRAVQYRTAYHQGFRGTPEACRAHAKSV